MIAPQRIKRRRKTRRPYTSGSNPVKSLMKILNDHNFKRQLSVTAEHLGVSEDQVLKSLSFNRGYKSPWI